ncbi:PDR/VanB family oxidoreductase [Streptomyces sp. SID3343]|uniref:PDR/VanB family oxidoreductase n=1 Tax=Streptomyces sp. SID3343 TaxID=2690260 RepID=UPI001370E866|nr:PDR/VanB family oxidoreductase [Streptomyces sp. SID3343]MYV99210.1 2Fe-2S iron-sulfur cluster binding domain-containing protein [Streptomyces sp. SID3343]
MQLLVRQVRWEAAGVVSLILTDPIGRDLPGWQPGAHIDLTVGDGSVRQYSLCGDPDDRKSYRIGVLREADGRGGSRFIHDRLRVGALIDVAGPRNHFPFHPPSRIRFVAGGIGITPLIPMIREAEYRGLDWELTYGGRSRASMAFLDELDSSRVHVHPADEDGPIDLDTALGDPCEDTAVYICGPGRLLDAVEERASSWPRGALHLERFSAPPAAVPESGDVPFEVVAKRSGITVTVPADGTILRTLENAGVSTLSSCSEGICGACETLVVDGKPDHRDHVLGEEEKASGEYIMICVSRACTERIVLDI